MSKVRQIFLFISLMVIFIQTTIAYSKKHIFFQQNEHCPVIQPLKNQRVYAFSRGIRYEQRGYTLELYLRNRGYTVFLKTRRCTLCTMVYPPLHACFSHSIKLQNLTYTWPMGDKPIYIYINMFLRSRSFNLAVKFAFWAFRHTLI